ncbi:uncharacterized protein DNG_09244 [Cephalotrichum gorgonifer]|uniref:Uncharacterized protein n=1 Tax=Cephalotrichum gorgonifer TaxID=2041049 RepID=A0AAE8SZ64_9PEZI|nr:uncharacterized protein DNG_09244 [Cephalotrichum gorgonifer]
MVGTTAVDPVVPVPDYTTSTNLGQLPPTTFPPDCLNSHFDLNTIALVLPWTYNTQECTTTNGPKPGPTPKSTTFHAVSSLDDDVSRRARRIFNQEVLSTWTFALGPRFQNPWQIAYPIQVPFAADRDGLRPERRPPRCWG